MRNIHIIVENNACDGCCECISACSKNNIFMVLDSKKGTPMPYIADKCAGCGACLDACRQREVLYCYTAAGDAVAAL